ncbi:unnamed protein product [Tuber aestivum]|uniref:GCS light chain n=1 Tax=Tuber aestivum TaxID=59557 RepID=A0A292PQC7_9PEZI|nr:unnamed protein product [Tuber aestivum]
MVSRYILSTGNVMTAGAEVIRKPTLEKSNTELVNSLRENFKAASSPALPPSASPNPAATSGPEIRLAPEEWTKLGSDGVLYVPAESSEPHGLAEDREEYDVTVKLFYLPGVPSSSRCTHTEEAVRLVCRELGISSIDLLIVSFPNISFDAEDEDISSEEDVSEWVRTYRTLESLHSAKKISKIGLAEFGTTRLSQLLPQTNVKPSVDQINVRDCCVVPKPLILYAKERGIELLTHNDCTDILPVDTLRQLVVDEFGLFKTDAKLVPQWVVKYTAVIRSRGVVENKGQVN